MKYIEVNFICSPVSEIVQDVLAAHLAETGFESFLETPDGITAYIPLSAFSIENIDSQICSFLLDTKITYTFKELEDKNWNEEWEKNFFKPIVFENECIIRSSFHKPDKKYRYDIQIDPKMAFGTGHHQTTAQVLKEMLKIDFKNKTVLDMGCGTAVLAILAAMMGAKKVVAIDIDEWAYNNAIENIKLNNANNIDVKLGGAELLGKQKFDIIIANINRNILLQDIPQYSNVLNKNGLLVLSGFYVEDIPALRAKCEENGIAFKQHSEMDNWTAIICGR